MDIHWGHKVFVQMIHKFDHAVAFSATHCHVVEHREVLDSLTKPYPSGVGADPDSELRREQEYSHVFIDTCDSGCVDLKNFKGFRLQELFEDHAVLHVLTSGNWYGSYTACYRSESQHVIGTRGLFEPRDTVWREVPHPLNGLGHIPTLVGVDGYLNVGSGDAACGFQAPDVVL